MFFNVNRQAQIHHVIQHRQSITIWGTDQSSNGNEFHQIQTNKEHNNLFTHKIPTYAIVFDVFWVWEEESFIKFNFSPELTTATREKKQAQQTKNQQVRIFCTEFLILSMEKYWSCNVISVHTHYDTNIKWDKWAKQNKTLLMLPK